MGEREHRYVEDLVPRRERDAGPPAVPLESTHEVMEELIDAAKVDELYKRGGGGDPYRMAVKLRRFFNGTHAKDLRGKRCAVPGSQAPWIEAILLSVGVKEVTTIEYAKITS